MPVRKIPRSYCNVTGQIAIPGQRSVQVESTLERDFVLRTMFHPRFRHIEEQPLSLPLPDTGGTYVPDFLVTWDSGQDLVEVKPAAKLVSDRARLKPRFAAGRAYCRAHGLTFRIVTEKHIRGPYLDNARFLLPYRQRRPDPDHCARMLGALREAGACTLEALLTRGAGGDRLHGLPVLWHLVATFRIGVDLHAPIDMNSLAKPLRGGAMASLSYQPGAVVRYQGRSWTIQRVLSASEVLLERRSDGRRVTARVTALESNDPATDAAGAGVLAPTEADLEEARRRLQIITPLVQRSPQRMQRQAEISAMTGVPERTLRRWLRAYTARFRLSDLAPRSSGREMPTRVPKRQEKLMAQVIEKHCLGRRPLSQKEAHEILKRECRKLRQDAPSLNTFRDRVRKARKAQHEKSPPLTHQPLRGSFPDASFPLAVIQIDHTLLDVALVHDDSRLPIGRVWITVAIDVYSRVLAGYYLSLDPPCAFAVAMCIAQAALPKEAHLERIGVSGTWPIWGKGITWHADNAKEFRGETIRASCEEHGIHLAWRPVKKPQFGGHVERYLGTFAERLKKLPGSTYRTSKTDTYNPDKAAAITLSEFERLFVEMVVNEYHVDEHSTLGRSPLQQWERGILGHGSTKGTGLPEPIQDPLRFWRDFLPFEERTVQREGIVWDGITYYGDALRPWIRASKGGRMHSFVVRRDPRDISRILFLDPDLNEYLEIPYRDISRPSMSLWDWKAAKSALRREGRTTRDEATIFEAHERMDAQVAQSISETKKARRRDQRRRVGAPPPAAVEKAMQTQNTTNPRPLDPAAPAQRLALVVDNTLAGDEYDIPDEIYATRLEEL